MPGSAMWMQTLDETPGVQRNVLLISIDYMRPSMRLGALWNPADFTFSRTTQSAWERQTGRRTSPSKHWASLAQRCQHLFCGGAMPMTL